MENNKEVREMDVNVQENKSIEVVEKRKTKSMLSKAGHFVKKNAKKLGVAALGIGIAVTTGVVLKKNKHSRIPNVADVIDDIAPLGEEALDVIKDIVE